MSHSKTALIDTIHKLPTDRSPSLVLVSQLCRDQQEYCLKSVLKPASLRSQNLARPGTNSTSRADHSQLFVIAASLP